VKEGPEPLKVSNSTDKKNRQMHPWHNSFMNIRLLSCNTQNSYATGR